MLKNKTERITIKRGNEQLTLNYFLTKSERKEGELYGAGIRIDESGEEAILDDISPNRERVEKFLELLSSNTVTPITLYDIYYDWAG